MLTEPRTIRIFGAPAEATVSIPETNEEYNAYSDEVGIAIKAESEDLLVKTRVKFFNSWVTVKAKFVPDKLKSSLMFQIYERTDVSEKN